MRFADPICQTNEKADDSNRGIDVNGIKVEPQEKEPQVFIFFR